MTQQDTSNIQTQHSYTLDLPYLAVIPYQLQNDDEIPDSTKIFYGQITGLSRKTGFIWATDEQLAEMKNTSLRNIQRWIKTLSDAGYITRETTNIPKKMEDGSFQWKKSRKIFVNEGFQREKPKRVIDENQEDEDSNNVCEPAINVMSLEPAINVMSLEPATSGGLINTSLDSNIKQQCAKQEVVVFSSLKKLEIDDALKIKISQDFTQDEVDLAVSRCLKWKSRPNDEVGVMTPLYRKDTWQDNPTKEDKCLSNETFLENLRKLDGTKIGVTLVTVGNKYIEFISGMKCVHYRVEDQEFMKNTTEYLEYLRNHK